MRYNTNRQIDIPDSTLRDRDRRALQQQEEPALDDNNVEVSVPLGLQTQYYNKKIIPKLLSAPLFISILIIYNFYFSNRTMGSERTTKTVYEADQAWVVIVEI